MECQIWLFWNVTVAEIINFKELSDLKKLLHIPPFLFNYEAALNQRITPAQAWCIQHGVNTQIPKRFNYAISRGFHKHNLEEFKVQYVIDGITF